MGAAATRFESGRRTPPRASRAATQRAEQPDRPLPWEALLHPALLPTVFVPSGTPAQLPREQEDEEDVAVRKV